MKKLLTALKNICHLYVKKSTFVNKVRFAKFQATYKVQNKTPDLLTLPPCKQSLVLHLKRANYIAKLWKSCLIPRIGFPDTTEHGWKSNGDVLWTTNEFADSIVELLPSTENVDFQDETVYFSEEESDDD